MKTVSPLRVVVKALFLFLLANLLFAWFKPPVGRLSIYNWWLPGRERFPFEEAENIYKGYNIPIFEDLDANFSAHRISAERKQPDEYRVFLLGDSSIWGAGNVPTDTLAGQLERMDLRTCDGRRIRFYNLGFPKSFLLKDLLVLERSLPYEPDMVLWFITLYGLTPSEIEEADLLAPHLSDINRLADAYGLRNYGRGFEHASFWERTIVGRRMTLKRGLLIQLFALPWAATGIDHVFENVSWAGNQTTGTTYLGQYHSTDDWKKLRRTFMMDVIEAGHTMAANTGLVFVNEPIYIDDGDSPRYNVMYPKWAYDLYREYVRSWMNEKHYPYADLWNAVSPAEFTDSPLHLSAAGEYQFAAELAPFIQDYSCVNP